MERLLEDIPLYRYVFKPRVLSFLAEYIYILIPEFLSLLNYHREWRGYKHTQELFGILLDVTGSEFIRRESKLNQGWHFAKDLLSLVSDRT